jgi:acetylornithine/N-succinyldiaminopimelate aminotransferase
MAKALGNGFPIGAFWVRDRYADLLGAGSHATTYGGTPLACTVAGKIFDIIERDRLADQVRATGDWLKTELARLAADYPGVVSQVRGLGFMLGLELVDKERIPALAGNEKSAAIQFVNRLHAAGVLTIPAGPQVVRLLPALNLKRSEAEEGLDLITGVVKSLAG